MKYSVNSRSGEWMQMKRQNRLHKENFLKKLDMQIALVTGSILTPILRGALLFCGYSM